MNGRELSIERSISFVGCFDRPDLYIKVSSNVLKRASFILVVIWRNLYIWPISVLGNCLLCVLKTLICLISQITKLNKQANRKHKFEWINKKQRLVHSILYSWRIFSMIFEMTFGKSKLNAIDFCLRWKVRAMYACLSSIKLSKLAKQWRPNESKSKFVYMSSWAIPLCSIAYCTFNLYFKLKLLLVFPI